MSFLNPVNEPVKRFSSTDASAPQINYNVRVAGDVKAVLKACLVTGYGAKASAGWSIVNEVDNVAEFVSPSAAMSDYRLGIDDTSTSTTTWYYQYQNTRVNPASNTPKKSIAQINKTHADNGWQLLVTQRGIYLIEMFFSTLAQALSTRVTYWGQVKTSVTEIAHNISFWNEGHDAADFSYNIHKSVKWYKFDNHVFSKWFAASPFFAIDITEYNADQAVIDLQSPIYLTSSSGVILGQQSGVLFNTINKSTDMFGVRDITINSRVMLHVCLGYQGSTASRIYAGSRNILIYLDYWEY